MRSFRRMAFVLIAAIMTAVATPGSSPAARPGTFSFVTISDVHIPAYGFPIGQPLDEETLAATHNSRRLRQFTEECLALRPRPAFVMNCGDTGDVGWTVLLRLYQKMMRPLVSVGVPVFTVVGNHDLDYAGIERRDLAGLFDPLGPASIGRGGTRYSFDHGGCHFVVLNNRPITGLIRLNPDDVEWLRRDLKSVAGGTRVLVFLHADMEEEDTHHVAELLQRFASPVVFHGHSHKDAIGRWGGVPVVVTGSLYGGEPKAGSFRVVTVTPRGISVRTRDFDQPAGIFGPETALEFLAPGPDIRIAEPEDGASVEGTLSVAAAVMPPLSGVMEYSISGLTDWLPLNLDRGESSASVPLYAAGPGRHLLRLRFTAENGAVTLAHSVFKIPGKGVREIWSRDLGSAVMGAPAVWRDRVIVPTIEKGICALRAGDGRVIWRRPVGEQVRGRVVVEGDTAYFGAGRTVYACRAKNGDLLWRAPLDGAIIAGVTVCDGKVWVPAGEHGLFCLHARRGKVLWVCRVDLPVIGEVAAEGGRVFFGSMDGCVRALDAGTGSVLWEKRVSSPEDPYTTAPYWPPAAAGELVIIGKIPAGPEEKNIIALSISDGSPAWSARASGVPLRVLADPGADRLYTLFTGERRGLQCLSLRDGSLLWSQESGVGMSAGIAARRSILLRDDEDVCCVDAATGAVQWTYRTSTGPQGTYYGPGAFAVRDRRAFVGTMDGTVTGLAW